MYIRYPFMEITAIDGDIYIVNGDTTILNVSGITCDCISSTDSPKIC